MPFIYSTLSNSQSVVIWKPYPGSGNKDNTKGSSVASERQHVIHIHGGANVIDFTLVTPKGVMTEVTDEELAALMKVSHFKRWVERGFITVENYDEDPDLIAKDMQEADGSAQITKQDHEERFEEGETSAEVVVDEPKPQRKRQPRKPRAKKPAEDAAKDAEE